MEEQAFNGKRKWRVTFLYLGTGIAFGGFVKDLARVARHIEEIDCTFVIATNRSLAEELARLDTRAVSMPTFDGRNPLRLVRNFVRARASILNFLGSERPDLVVTLMPHVWSPLLALAIRRRCAAYVTVIHDAVPHPGDRTGWLTRWLTFDGALAHSIVVLSRSVRQTLENNRFMRHRRIVQLFHPDLMLSSKLVSRQLQPTRPFKLLFFGRVMPYKGLPLLVEAVELLKKEGIDVALGVVGSGDIAPLEDRLSRLGAEVINRWVSDVEVGEVLARYDAMACSHIEASQSGVASLAFGNCMPVVATPIGGLVDQVLSHRTGVLAAEVSPRAFADAVHRLIAQQGLYNQISRHLAESHSERSMETFVRELVHMHCPDNRFVGAHDQMNHSSTSRR